MSFALKQHAQGLARPAGSRRSSCPRVGVRPVVAGIRQVVPRRASVVVCAATSNQKVQERWESQVRDGRVKNISTADLQAMQKDGWVLLDVRPPTESSKAPVAGAVQVPLFVPDPSNDLGALIKKATDFGMGSWWLGGTHYVPNNNFLSEVQSKIPANSRVIVACQKGLRSLAACEQLANAGYQQLAWVNGGFDTAKAGDVPTTNGKDIRYSGIGGLSEAIGWTDVQREERKDAGLLGGIEGVIKVFSLILLADGLLFAYEYINYWRESGTGPFAQ